MSRIMAKAGRKTAKTARNSRPQPATEAMLPRQRRNWLLGGTGLITGSVVMAAASFLPAGPAWAACITANAGVNPNIVSCDAAKTTTNTVVVNPANATYSHRAYGFTDGNNVLVTVTGTGSIDGYGLAVGTTSGDITMTHEGLIELDFAPTQIVTPGDNVGALHLETENGNIFYNTTGAATGDVISDVSGQHAFWASTNGTGNVTVVNKGTLKAESNAAAVFIVDSGTVSVTNSSMNSALGDTDGLYFDHNNKVIVPNDGGLIIGRTEDGLDINETKGFGEATSIDVSNNGGIIAGYGDGIDIDDTWNGDTVIRNADGLILGVNGDGIEIDDIDGAVRITNTGTGAANFNLADISSDPDADSFLTGIPAALNVGQRGIFGGEDGIDIDQVDHYVFVDNTGGTILGADGHGIRIDDVDGDKLVNSLGTYDTSDGVVEYSVVVLNASSVTGSDGDGIHLTDIKDGGVYIRNGANSPTSTITGYWDGIDIDDVYDGNVHIDNLGGTIVGQHDDGIELDEIDGNVRIVNQGTINGGTTTNTGDDGIDIDEVDDYVFVDNRGGTINGYNGDGVRINDVDGGYLINADGTTTGAPTYAVVVLSASGIYGGENGVKIEDIKEGGVLVESGGNSGTSNITGYDGDGVKIRDVDDGPVDVVNYSYSTIKGSDDGVYIKDTDGDPGEDVTVTNYYHGTIEGEYGSGIQVKDAEEDVRIHNSGDILGKGGWHSAVVDIDTKDGAYINNYAGGVIQSNYVGVNSDNWGDIAIKSRTNDGTWINNWGTINGRVFLDNEDDTFNNYSDNSWNVTGWNDFGHYDDDLLNNEGTINVRDWTVFKGLDLLDNKGGLINMHYAHNYSTDDVLYQKGDYDGEDYARLQVDTKFGKYGDSDLLKIKGDIYGSTEIIVHKVNKDPGGFNWKGIDVVSYKYGDGGGCDDYLCKEGDTFFISSLSPYYVNIDGYGAIEDGLYDQFLHHDYKHKDYEFKALWGIAAIDAAGLITGAQNIFYDTLRVVEDNKYGYQFASQGGGGADLPIEEAPVTSSSGGANAGLWVKAKGSWTERDTSVEENGLVYDTGSSQDIYSILGGADMKPWGEDSPVRIGLFGGYVTSNLDFDVGSPEADYEGGVIGAYAAYNNGAFYVDGTVKGDLLKTTYSFSGQEADADVTSIGGSLNTGYRMHAGRAFFEPIASLEFVHSSVDDFNNAGTTVDFSNGQSIRAGAGAKIGTNVATMGGSTTELSLLGKVWNEFEDANSVTVTGGGQSATFSDDISGVFGEVAATATVVSADGTSSGFISAGGQFGEDFTSFKAEAGLRKGF